MNNKFFQEVSKHATIETNISLKTLTSFRVGGFADYVIYPNNEFSLVPIINCCKEENIPFVVFGNGSNILCSDEPYHGAIIKLNRTFNNFYFDNEYLTAQAGCSIITLAYKALDQDLTGLEFASGIPATIGGTVYMNAGAYKSELSEVVSAVQVLIDDNLVWLEKEQCEFGYRQSIFQKHKDWVIVSVKLKLQKGNHEDIDKLMLARKERRMSTQPLDYPSAGSTFRNPEGSFAWKYIDEIGYRGKIIGGAQVSEKHSNFIININNAKASDIDSLTQEIKQKVKDQFGIELHMEVEKFNWNK